jgi:hypothetical protein
MIGTWLRGRATEDVEDGTVFCGRRQDRVDVERCYTCPLQRRLARGEDGSVSAVACAYGAWDRASFLTN